MGKPIKSCYSTDVEIIQGAMELHANGRDIDLDPTYSSGVFYKCGAIKKPKHTYDLNPKYGVETADVRALPLPDESVFLTMFDPPFLATKGPSLKLDRGNEVVRRFGSYEDEKSLHGLYIEALKELHRVAEAGGILIFKCQDKVSSSKQYFSHVFIHNEAVKAGWYPKDLFIKIAKARMTPAWQVRNQKHARKYHSYFWVFEKCGKKIGYT